MKMSFLSVVTFLPFLACGREAPAQPDVNTEKGLSDRDFLWRRRVFFSVPPGESIELKLSMVDATTSEIMQLIRSVESDRSN